MRTQRRGLTMVEAVVVLCLVLVSLMLLAPAIHGAREEARQSSCINNLKRIGLALHDYNDTWGTLPMSRVEGGEGHGVGHSNGLAILPFMEFIPVYNAYNFSVEPWNGVNSTVTRTKMNVYLCPDNSKDVAARKAEAVPTLDGKKYPGTNKFFPIHYGANWGGGHKGYGDDFVKDKGTYRGVMMTVITPEGRKKGARNVRLDDVTDGWSFTVAMAEKLDGASWTIGGWANSEFDVNDAPAYTGDDAKAKMVFPGSVHPNGPNMLMCDGSVRVLTKDIEKAVWYSLMTRDGAEVIAANAIGPPLSEAREAVETKNDIVYREVDGRELKLDLARPKGDGPFPGLVIIHGGGWRAGDKSQMRPLLEQAAKLGYVAVSPQYRFAPDDQYPAQIHDVKAAVRWLRQHAKEYHLDSDHIGAMGFSAGGHLSLMLGVTDRDDGLEGAATEDGPDTRVQAVVNYFGPTDLGADNYPDVVKDMIKDLLGGPPSEKADLVKQASPLTFVTKDDPPVLTFQGTKDPLVPFDQAIKLADSMTESGVPGRVELLIGGGHGFAKPSTQRTLEEAFLFLDEHLK